MTTGAGTAFWSGQYRIEEQHSAKFELRYRIWIVFGIWNFRGPLVLLAEVFPVSQSDPSNLSDCAHHKCDHANNGSCLPEHRYAMARHRSSLDRSPLTIN